MAFRTIAMLCLACAIAVAAKGPAPAPSRKVEPAKAPKSSIKAPAPAPMERDCSTLADFLSYYSDRYGLLKAAIESSPELEKFATGCKKSACPKQYTILVPSDKTIESFARGIGSNVTDLFEDQARLEDIIRNHIIVGNNGTFVDGEELETALTGSNLGVFTNTEGTQTCFMSWSYACVDGVDSIEQIKGVTPLCQGQAIRVNSMVMPPVLEDGTTDKKAATTAGRRL